MESAPLFTTQPVTSWEGRNGITFEAEGDSPFRLDLPSLPFTLVLDNSLPDGVIEIREHDGTPSLRIENVGGGPKALLETCRLIGGTDEA